MSADAAGDAAEPSSMRRACSSIAASTFSLIIRSNSACAPLPPDAILMVRILATCAASRPKSQVRHPSSYQLGVLAKALTSRTGRTNFRYERVGCASEASKDAKRKDSSDKGETYNLREFPVSGGHRLTPTTVMSRGSTRRLKVSCCQAYYECACSFRQSHSYTLRTNQISDCLL